MLLLEALLPHSSLKVPGNQLPNSSWQGLSPYAPRTALYTDRGHSHSRREMPGLGGGLQGLLPQPAGFERVEGSWGLGLFR